MAGSRRGGLAPIGAVQARNRRGSGVAVPRWSIRWPQRALVAALCLTCAVTSCSKAAEVSGRNGGSQRSWRVVQFNLCDSGIASCYTGRSVGAAAAVIGEWRPDIVTLNEVCSADVPELGRALSRVHRGMVLTSGFMAAVDRRSDSPFRCRNGEQYGIAVLAVGARPGLGNRRYGGRYPVQDLADPEERVWLCIAAAGLHACTTHTASTSSAVALGQCRYLTRKALPALPRRHGRVPVVLAADFNLPFGSSPGIRPCLENRYRYAGDGSRQDVVASPGLTLTTRAVIDMHRTTDHPALFVTVTGRGGPAAAAG